MPNTDSLSVLMGVVPRAKTIYLSKLDDAIKEKGELYEIDTPKRISAFLAQSAHETLGFTKLVEMGPNAGAQYEGRAILGNTQKGDGRKYKGRGFLQTTGRYNYGELSKIVYGKSSILLDNPELLETIDVAILSAFVFWKIKNCAPLADAGDFERLTKRINGGLNGYSERKIYLMNFTKAISFSPALFLANRVKKKSSFFNGLASGGYFGFFFNFFSR